MKTETLATAFAAALKHVDRSGGRIAPPPALPAPASGDLLLDALRHSATDRDQIMLRRIGLMTAAHPDTPAAIA